MNLVRDRSDAAEGAYAVLLALADHADEFGETGRGLHQSPSLERLAVEARLRERSSVIRAIQKLEALGELRVERHRGQSQTNWYAIDVEALLAKRSKMEKRGLTAPKNLPISAASKRSANATLNTSDLNVASSELNVASEAIKCGASATQTPRTPKKTPSSSYSPELGDGDGVFEVTSSRGRSRENGSEFSRHGAAAPNPAGTSGKDVSQTGDGPETRGPWRAPIRCCLLKGPGVTWCSRTQRHADPEDWLVTVTPDEMTCPNCRADRAASVAPRREPVGRW